MKKNVLAVLSHNPVIILIALTVLLLIVYFIASPYQICNKVGDITPLKCLELTSW
ncbi:hypothetical protein N8081_01000 [Pseudomonadota bacterium]|nr:hypothetical protein [Pseudomonadota bacterium]